MKELLIQGKGNGGGKRIIGFKRWDWRVVCNKRLGNLMELFCGNRWFYVFVEVLMSEWENGWRLCDNLKLGRSFRDNDLFNGGRRWLI